MAVASKSEHGLGKAHEADVGDHPVGEGKVRGAGRAISAAFCKLVFIHMIMRFYLVKKAILRVHLDAWEKRSSLIFWPWHNT